MTLWDDTHRALPQRVQPPVWPLAALAEHSVVPFGAIENSVRLREAADCLVKWRQERLSRRYRIELAPRLVQQH